MPKNNPKPPLPYRPTVSAGRKQGAGTASARAVETTTILIDLIDVQANVVKTLKAGDAVLPRITEERGRVYTLMGSLVGTISAKDVLRLQGRSALSAQVRRVEISPPACQIEVVF